MNSNNNQINIVVPGGGSGCISIEEGLFRYTDNIFGITPCTDNGGHSGLIRTSKGLLPPGDASQRMAIRFKNVPSGKKLDILDKKMAEIAKQAFQYRDKDSGERPVNSLIAAFEEKLGSHSLAIKALERLMNGYYRGRVIPITDDNAHLRLYLSDGSIAVGEEYIDHRKKNSPSIIQMDFVKAKPDKEGNYRKIQPKINEEAVEVIKEADLIVIPPGTWEGSIKAVTEIPGFYENAKDKQIFQVTNALDIDGRNAEVFLKEISEKLGRKVDVALVNNYFFKLPQSYKLEGLEWVKYSIEECKKYAHEVIEADFVDLYKPNSIPTIRHKGEFIAELIVNLFQNKNSVLQSNTKLIANV